MKNSATAPSSRRATFVSWGVLLTMRSLFMEASFHEPPPSPTHAGRGRAGCGSGESVAECDSRGRRLDWRSKRHESGGAGGGLDSPPPPKGARVAAALPCVEPA